MVKHEIYVVKCHVEETHTGSQDLYHLSPLRGGAKKKLDRSSSSRSTKAFLPFLLLSLPKFVISDD